jgi:hypothetical protein
VSLSRRSLFKAAAGAAGLILLPEPVIAAPEPVRHRFWPGWRGPGRGGLDAFITAQPGLPGPLTSAHLEAELEALWRVVAQPQPWDLLYVETDRLARQGEIGLWTGIAFIPLWEMTHDGSSPGHPSVQYQPGGIIQVTPQQIAEWTR